MTLFIYKHRLTNQIETAKGQAIAEDHELIWKGESWEKFTEETGLDESQLKGLKIKSGKVIFDSSEKEKQLDSEKPLAMGIDLINFINKTTVNDLSDDDAFELVEKLSPFLLFLQQGRCNPASEETLRVGLELLDKKLINAKKDLIVSLVNEWKKDKRFIEAPITRPKTKK